MAQPKQQSMTAFFFDQIILKKPILMLGILIGITVMMGYQARHFKLDASAETLVLENDKDLALARTIYARYGEQDFLVVTYTPHSGDLLSDSTLAHLRVLKKVFSQLEGIESVVTLLDVPLLESPPVPVKELVNNLQTLSSPGVDKHMVRSELQESPLYRDLIVSPDLSTTALLLYLNKDKQYQTFIEERDRLKAQKRKGAWTPKDEAALEELNQKFDDHRDRMKQKRHAMITAIRNIMDSHRDDADLFLGGVSMIADDLISFIKKDLKLFGIGVLFFLIITLRVIFKSYRFIFLPICTCSFSAILMVGLLGTFDWEVTVISSNFISLQLIITMAVTIHLIVRYRELQAKKPHVSQKELVLDTVTSMVRPCVFATLTTIAGFASLLFCDILPVITFGWMMSAGIFVSLIITFLLFPTLLMITGKGPPPIPVSQRYSITTFFAILTEKQGNKILGVSLVALILSVLGITRLEVENSFIDYFKEDTEIYQGMKLIDQKLGGTTPLDVLYTFESSAAAANTKPEKKIKQNGADVFDEFDEFDESENQDKYWFTEQKMVIVMKIHDYLDGLKETGKVLSLGTMLKIAQKLNNGKPLDNFALALVYSELPENFKSMVLTPYVSIPHDQVRFSVRVRDSDKSLRRNALLKKIQNDLSTLLNRERGTLQLSGMLVLYNNMLQSLFKSQILTLGIVILALMFMFLILFRSLKIAIIAIFPNALSTSVVLGIMGWLNIPLDMMTITIAAISIGIAVDDTIHYIHRYMKEFTLDRDYIATVHRCHGSIGHAMYYTSLTIIIGFSILILSNFIPSIYFGLLTGLSMLIALIAALTLLPRLLIWVKPFGTGCTS